MLNITTNKWQHCHCNHVCMLTSALSSKHRNLTELLHGCRVVLLYLDLRADVQLVQYN